MKHQALDFAVSGIRPFSNPKIAHGLEVVTNPDAEMDDRETIVVDVVDFIQYLIDTNVMPHGSFVNGYRDGLVVEVVNTDMAYNHQRGEFDEYSGTRSCTIQEFISDYPTSELEGELIKYLEVSNA